jgi:predicted nucleotidyltransferase
MSVMIRHNIDVPTERIAEFCRKWKITEFSLFGSILRDDFRPDSDVDVLVVLAADAPWDLFDRVDMIDELRTIFGREVDLVEKTAIRNPFRRRRILKTHEVVYAA